MRIQLSDNFNYNRLVRFVLPSVAMMIFTSIYSVVDGLFVSNFVGKTSFAAVNLIMPIIMAMGTIGFMIGTGGSAIISKALGEGKPYQANRYFSMLVYVSVILGIFITVVGLVFIHSIVKAIGAEGEIAEQCVIYGRIMIASITPFILQSVFQSFFITAEKPGLSLKITATAGFTNMLLDFLFVAIFKWGIAGAAVATAISQIIGGIIPLIYFSRKNSSLLKLTRTKIEKRILLNTFTNGSSEMMTNLSTSLVNILYNYQLINIIGEDGISAYGVIMYINFIFTAVFIGYSIGIAPVIGYHYGSGNSVELKSLFKKSIILVGISGIVMTLLSEFLAGNLSKIFVGYDSQLCELTSRGFRIYAISFLASGFNIFGSAFFTALSNGLVSAIISFMRTLLFQLIFVIMLPMIIGLDGIWLSIVAAELAAVFVTIIFFIKMKDKYNYL
ncbi:multidrug export protein MepA [Clostridiales bacterium]|nr:multidrug export protein MepA [Clostridiales bacterium]